MTDSGDDVHFFNDCLCRDHTALYGDGAFYDLNTTGRQAHEALNLRMGQECVVAAITPDNQIIFKWYLFLRETRMRVDTESDCRVFFGSFLMSETLSKEHAAQDRVYSIFFDKNGNFKAGHSWLCGAVPQDDRRARRRRATSPLPEEIAPSTGPLFEGAMRHITVNAYERNDQARAKCIEHYGAVCAVCDMSFADVYGPIADGLIHVHHLKPLADVAREYAVDPVADLRPICPNCHAVIHIGGVTRSITEVKALLQRSAHRTR
ncbi:MAG: hypothetical protein MUC88_24530 [Planctomycetes bacterium]|jgi:hypothetical protein|nr:hypothetical protein [Planctomycetota bacterium]